MPLMHPTAPAHLAPLLDRLRDRARAAGVFADCRVADGMLECDAKDAAAAAHYRVFHDDGRLWVALVTRDRWLSQSIEQDLVHTGDKLTDLLEEELVEVGYDNGALPFEHFRDEEKLFTFRSPLPIDLSRAGDEAAAGVALQCLLAYEATFRPLGDMEGGDED